MNRTFLLTLALSALIIPHAAFAATKVSCAVTVTSPRGQVTVREASDILIKKGEQLTLSWESTNAKKATGSRGVDIKESGMETLTATNSETRSFKFANGSKKADCSVSFVLAEGSFTASTLSTDDTKPTLKGIASGSKTIRLRLEDASGKKVFESREVKVKKNKWEVDVSKTLKEGSYTATLFGAKDMELSMLATSTLRITAKGVRGGSLSVSSLPLLTGGVAANGASVPVAYIQVRNPGSTPASLNGFTLTETGSITDDVVVGFTTNDDKGGSRATTTSPFSRGSVFVPLAATVAPGQVRIFTLKAILSPAKRLYGNAELKINVAGIDTSANVTGAFPIIGTTWILR